MMKSKGSLIRSYLRAGLGATGELSRGPKFLAWSVLDPHIPLNRHYPHSDLQRVSDTTMSTEAAPVVETSVKGLLAKADVIADTFRSEVKTALEKCTRPPKLVGILSTSSVPSRSYAQFTKKQCEEMGVEFVLKTTGAAQAEGRSEGEGVEEAIIEANADETVDGIMVRMNFLHEM